MDEENIPWVYPEHLVESQIVDLLHRSGYFTKVRYEGSIHLMGFNDYPPIFIRHEAAFYDSEGDTWDVPAEYMPGSPTRILMEEIVSIFVDHDEEEGCEVWLEDVINE